MTARIHVSLAVKNIEESVSFYEALFGQEPHKRRDDYANWRLSEPPLMLSLVPGADTGPRSDEHLGVELGELEGLTKMKTAIEGRGLEVRPEEGAVCCYATAEKFWVTDPDGNPWEFWVKTGEADVMHKADDECCVVPAGAESSGAESSGAESSGAESSGAESSGAESSGAKKAGGSCC